MNSPFNVFESTLLNDISRSLRTLKEGTVESIEVIGTLSKMVINAVDWVGTILFNPVMILTFIDKMSLVIIVSLIILKVLGFDNLEKWILLGILAKVIAMVLL